MSAPVLGIDLGTTNSVVAISEGGNVRVLADPEGRTLLPSVVSFHPRGRILVGNEARERRLIDALNTVHSVKRLIGRPFSSDEAQTANRMYPFQLVSGPGGATVVNVRSQTFTLPEISAFVLRKIKDIAEVALGQPCVRAVVTVPANFNELQRAATKAAANVAGLEVLRILNEPTAAALAYGFRREGRERVAVFDFGGGTFDVTILDLAGDVFEVLATAGDTYLGGNDLDGLLADRMADAFLAEHRVDLRADPQAFERLRAAGEWAKCELSKKLEVRLDIEELAYGDGGTALDLTFQISRQELDDLARPLIARTFEVCEEAFRISGLRPTQLDNVILVGGSTRMPLVRSMVEENFGMAPMADLNPDVVVAWGAAIQAEVLGHAPPAVREWVSSAPPADLEGGTVGPSGASPVIPRAPAVPADTGLPIPPPSVVSHPAPVVVLGESAAPVAHADAPPLLLDVTPHTLSIETMAGYCEPVIKRNNNIPTENVRLFSTAVDNQDRVSARICQGESRKLDENQELGMLDLSGIRPARRGDVQIEVTFIIDANGMLRVQAMDKGTGRRQTVEINLVGGVSKEEVAAMRDRQDAMIRASES